jgi:hypothetical protein
MDSREIVERGTILRATVGSTIHGNLHGQKERLLGSRGQRVNRPELVQAHGYDTRYAMHAARLGYQGLELLETGELTLPMPDRPDRAAVDAFLVDAYRRAWGW